MDDAEKIQRLEWIEQIVADFCLIILTQKDSLDSSDIQKAQNCLKVLTSDDILKLNSDDPEIDSHIRTFVLNKIVKYIESFYHDSDAQPYIKRPFEFDSGRGYLDFCEKCEKYYQEIHPQSPFPRILGRVLQYIKEISEHYRIFGHFYEIRSKQTSNSIVQRLEEVAEKKADEAAERRASEAVKEALKKNIEESAKCEVKKAVEIKMAEITRKNSETSVTILGIFSGIVVTFVGSWIYSSSILASVKDANFFRLISVAALVGLISFCLIYVMFRFIEKLSGKGADREQESESTITGWWKEHFPGWVAIVICTVLIVIMALGIHWQFKCPEKGDSKSFEESQSDTDNSEPVEDINVNVNIDTSDGVEISTEDSSTISETEE